MKRYRKKPIVIEAEQWFAMGDLPGVVLQYPALPHPSPSLCPHCSGYLPLHGAVETLEGVHIVCPGDWIIKGIKGEFYPCKPDVFQATYDEVEP